MIHQKMRAFQDFTTQSIFAVTSRRSGTVQNRPVPALDDRYLRYCDIAYLVIGANGSVRGKKVTSLARWPPNPSRCWALTWRTIGPMEDYWARSGGLLAEWPLSTSGGVFPLTRLTTCEAM